MIRLARTPRLATSGRPSHFGPAAAAGLILWLGWAAPAGAGYAGFPNQPGYTDPNPEPARAAKPRRAAARPKQQVALYGQDGFIAQAGISTGMPGHPTPLGVFTVISKAKWHQSNIYSGAPMPYMQRITWSGIAMHAGPRPGYPASHGCIRLPEDFAIRLFHATKVGARVIVTREPAAPVEIAHPKLFVPKKPDEKAAAAAAEEPSKAALS